MTTLRISLGVLIFVAMTGASAHAQVDPEDCFGQGGSMLLMKGSCAAGSDVKIKMAGQSGARYKLFMDLASGPVEMPGLGTFCIDFGPNKTLIEKGRLSPLGFRSLWATMPDDPAFLGEEFAFQFVSEDDFAPNGVAISNAIIFRGCEAGSNDPCDRGVRRLGYFTIVETEDDGPTTINVRVEGVSGQSGTVGEVTFEYDPQSPPLFPISSVADESGDGVTVTNVQSYPGYVIVHAVAKGCTFANGRLPNECLFETTVGDVVAGSQIHTSCSVPLGAGSRFPPVFITFFQDVKNAPSGDCD